MTDDDIQTLTEDDIRHLRADYKAPAATSFASSSTMKPKTSLLCD